jgi:N-acetylmuramoyl-L-alanine amidase
MPVVDITKAIVPKGRKWGRTGRKLVGSRTVTIHNTANEGATAKNHAAYLLAGHAISWHFTVDDKGAYQHVPTDEQAWHTGTNDGNTTSIGVEVCEFKDKERQLRGEKKACWLAARMLDHRGLTVSSLRTHKSWSGKECPRDILPHWSSFKRRVAYYIREMNRPYPGTRLKVGSKGEDVAWVQRMLIRQGFRTTKPTSVYDAATGGQVKKFRESVFKARPQGTSVGSLTWGRLCR